MLRPALLSLAFVAVTFAAEPFLKPNDVIALVGGEDMVAAAEYGYLELLLQRALPGHRLKVRSLAWEGDTVFEQPRDLNYPTLEAQLDEIGATVVIMQFGQMESLAGTSKLPEFIQAYEKLIERVSAGGKRRVVNAPPTRPDPAAVIYTGSEPSRLSIYSGAKQAFDAFNASFAEYDAAIDALADKTGPKHLPRATPALVLPSAKGVRDYDCELTKDGIHAEKGGHAELAFWLAMRLLPSDPLSIHSGTESEQQLPLAAIRAKNRLWFHYYRPQNWAFLAGDRTEQPSSRDHKDPSKRWFPEEMKEWLGLIEAKEKEIWALAGKAAKP